MAEDAATSARATRENKHHATVFAMAPSHVTSPAREVTTPSPTNCGRPATPPLRAPRPSCTWCGKVPRSPTARRCCVCCTCACTVWLHTARGSARTPRGKEDIGLHVARPHRFVRLVPDVLVMNVLWRLKCEPSGEVYSACMSFSIPRTGLTSLRRTVNTLSTRRNPS